MAEDFHKGHCQLLGQLTQIGDITEAAYNERFRQMAASGDTYHTIVIEDTTKNLIIGSATLIIELKFIRSCSRAGHIEDVVVNTSYRGKNLGLRLIGALKEIASARGCYKVMLDCSESNMKFYAKMGFRESERHMRCDL